MARIAEPEINTAFFGGIARGMAEATGGVWAIANCRGDSRDGWNCVLSSTVGYGVSLDASRWGDWKLNVRGVYPKDVRDSEKSYGNMRPNAIRISTNKSPEAIGREIVRRFLPDYIVAFDAEMRLVQEANAYWKDVWAATEELAAMFGVKPDGNDHKQFKTRYDKWENVGFRVEGEVFSDYVTVEIKLGRDKAKHFLKEFAEAYRNWLPVVEAKERSDRAQWLAEWALEDSMDHVYRTKIERRSVTDVRIELVVENKVVVLTRTMPPSAWTIESETPLSDTKTSG